MEFGVMLPVSGPFASAAAITAMAKGAEALGYDAVSVHDHINWDARDKYHFMAGTADAVEEAEGRGDWPYNFYEHVVTFAYVAGATTRLKLLSAATVLPWRHPVLLAKQAATLQELSGGRLMLSVCVGNVRGDFEATGMSFAERGAIMNEYLEALTRALSPEEEVVQYQGKYLSIERGSFFPKPNQKLPILYAGEGNRALRRAARFCDGWLPLGSPQFVGERVPRLHDYLREQGRESAIAAFRVGILTKVCIAGSDRAAQEKAQHTLVRQVGLEEIKRHPTLAEAYIIGAPETIVRRLHEYASVGVSITVLAFIAPTLEETLQDMEIFARQVMGRV